MTNEQLAAYLYQLACRMQYEINVLDGELTGKQQVNNILTPVKNIVFELKEQVKMLTGKACPPTV